MGFSRVAFMVVAAAMCLVTPAICMDYFTGQSSRRTLKQGPGGITCQGQYQSAQYRCNSLQSRPNNYQFCVRLCDTGLGRARAADNSQSPSLVGGAGNFSTVTGSLGGAGNLGGASLGGSGLIASGGGGGAAGCVPCQDVQQKCQEGASLGGNSQQFFQPYVQRYYTGLGCVDAGPNVKPAAATAAASTSPSGSPSSSPRSSPSPA